jgi:hypothetical protein
MKYRINGEIDYIFTPPKEFYYIQKRRTFLFIPYWDNMWYRYCTRDLEVAKEYLKRLQDPNRVSTGPHPILDK